MSLKDKDLIAYISSDGMIKEYEKITGDIAPDTFDFIEPKYKASCIVAMDTYGDLLIVKTNIGFKLSYCYDECNSFMWEDKNLLILNGHETIEVIDLLTNESVKKHTR